MAKKLHQIFPSKLLLFGEHIINKGAKGLAMPTALYSGFLAYDKAHTPQTQQSNLSLKKIADFIIQNEAIERNYDCNLFLEELEDGLFFDSNIPQGYGLGSSGAVVAALYYRYRKNKSKLTIQQIKEELAALESVFHGKSSGLDPIVAYLQQSVLLENGTINKIFSYQPKGKKITLFLINTGIARQTAPWVQLFLEKYQNATFQKQIDNIINPANNACIDSFLAADYASFYTAIKILSQAQLELLPEFIPAAYHTVWKDGLKNNNYLLKLCGAGGGGFIIGFCKHDYPVALHFPFAVQKVFTF